MSEPVLGKNFQDWLLKKEAIHNENELPIFKEGEIWWAAIGENVGVEVNGKHADFSRPVVIFKKLSRFGFLAIPLTSQPHEGSWYASFEFRNKNQYAALSQIRMMSAARLYNRMGSLSKSDFTKLKEAFKNLVE